ncbi:hypothetical protein VPH35_122956 [Triticum aestivum]
MDTFIVIFLLCHGEFETTIHISLLRFHFPKLEPQRWSTTPAPSSSVVRVWATETSGSVRLSRHCLSTREVSPRVLASILSCCHTHPLLHPHACPQQKRRWSRHVLLVQLKEEGPLLPGKHCRVLLPCFPLFF